MNPNCGFYQQGPRCNPELPRDGRRMSFGYSTQTPGCSRAPATFSPSAGNLGGNQQNQWGGSCARPRQGVGRTTGSNPCRQRNVNITIPGGQGGANFALPQIYTAPAAPPESRYTPGTPQFCSPQAIKVNVTAEQLQNASNCPVYNDRGECSQEGNGNVKYIQLNWNDLLGGMENLRVSMAPSADASNPNRQLKVSFGGQKTDPPQAGETQLKVVSIQPAQTTERMDVKDGNAYAGRMKVCEPPTMMRMTPAVQAARYAQRNRTSYMQTELNKCCNRGKCRR